MLLAGGTVVDGTEDSEPTAADILVEEGIITAVGGAATRERHRVDQVIDATGAIVAPGFIDSHSHADAAAFLDPDISKISQGVTTEIIGNCGFSLAPITDSHRAEFVELAGRLFPPLPFSWRSLEEMNEHVDGIGLTVNAATLVGHHTLRAEAMGTRIRPPTTQELEHMQGELRTALSQGSLGLSTGLIYPPGMFADVSELKALAQMLSPDHVYATHLRSEGANLLDSVREAVAIAAYAGSRLQISHLKAAGTASHGKVKRALAILEDARGDGLTVHHDVYPYTANSTMLASCLPPWFHTDGRDHTLRLLRDSVALEKAEAELSVDDGTWDNWVAASGWSNVLIAGTFTHQDEGRTLLEAASDRRRTPFGALVDILVENDLRATMSVFAMRESDLLDALRAPFAMIGSDGLPRGNGGKPHPRLFGTFTRVLGRYVREQAAIDLPTAIAMMTSRPAAAFGLTGRGEIRVGAVADLVVLDPTTVGDQATFVDPERLSTGIEHVILAGVSAYANRALSRSRSGRRLTRSSTTPTASKEINP